MSIARQIKEARIASGLTQAQVADMANVHSTMISSMERGTYSDRVTPPVQRVLDVLGIGQRPQVTDYVPSDGDWRRAWHIMQAENTLLRNQRDELLEQLIG